jgi:hypothetical protein
MNAHTPKLQDLLDAGTKLAEAAHTVKLTGLGNSELAIAIAEYELSRLIWDQECEIEADEFARYYKVD